MNLISATRLAAVASALSLACLSALAEDTYAQREAAADRYLQAVPMAKMMDDMISELSKQIPEEKRAHFLQFMKTAIRMDYLERLTRESMIKTFTTDELNALADYYGSQHGVSAARKFGVYLAEIMPALQAEMQRAVKEMKFTAPTK